MRARLLSDLGRLFSLEASGVFARAGSQFGGSYERACAEGDRLDAISEELCALAAIERAAERRARKASRR